MSGFLQGDTRYRHHFDSGTCFSKWSKPVALIAAECPDQSSYIQCLSFARYFQPRFESLDRSSGENFRAAFRSIYSLEPPNNQAFGVGHHQSGRSHHQVLVCKFSE